VEIDARAVWFLIDQTFDLMSYHPAGDETRVADALVRTRSYQGLFRRKEGLLVGFPSREMVPVHGVDLKSLRPHPSVNDVLIGLHHRYFTDFSTGFDGVSSDDEDALVERVKAILGSMSEDAFIGKAQSILEGCDLVFVEMPGRVELIVLIVCLDLVRIVETEIGEAHF